MRRIIFISNVDTGFGMSGGSRIYFEFLKNWNEISKTIFSSAGTISRLKKESIKEAIFVETTSDDDADLFSISGIFYHTVKRLTRGIIAIKNNPKIIEKSDYVYSVSDFYPDFFPALYAKLKNRDIIWIAGFYLFAPAPFSKISPYKGADRLRGLLYWIMQRPSYLIAKYWADIVLVTSEPDVKKFLTKNRKRGEIIVVQGGVDITESERYLCSGNIIPINKRTYDACFVGRFHYQKGVLGLIDIWKKVTERKKDAKLAIIGNGGLEAAIKKKIRKYHLEKNVDMLGFKDGQAKYEIFKQSKVMLHPATYDSGGMAAAEGMAWGLPGVSFDLEALETYYPKGMLKTKINDQKEFAENILRLLNDSSLYEKTSKEAYALIKEVWDWKIRSKKVFELITQRK